MTDPRIDALLKWTGDPADIDILEVLDAADLAAGWVRINLNDDEMLGRLSEAIDVPSSFAKHDGVETYQTYQQRAIRAALQQPAEQL